MVVKEVDYLRFSVPKSCSNDLEGIKAGVLNFQIPFGQTGVCQSPPWRIRIDHPEFVCKPICLFQVRILFEEYLGSFLLGISPFLR